MPRTFFNIAILVSILTLTSCSVFRKNDDYASEPEYKKLPQLTQPITTGTLLSEGEIQKILTSRIVLPKAINLAIVRVTDETDQLSFQTVDDELVAKFYEKANWGPRVRSVFAVPQMLLTKPVTMNNLRQTAAVLQADALLIIKPTSYGDWKFKIVEKDEAKAITSLEVLLLDTRTNAVPFTAIITETVEIKEKSGDYSKYELVARAKKASEAKALLQVAPAVQKFISKVL